METVQEYPMEKIMENYQMQLSELESLESMFYNPGEIRVNSGTLAEIKDFVEGKSSVIPPYLDLTINVIVQESKFEVTLDLSNKYPQSEPEIYVRNHKLNRPQHMALNERLKNYVSGLDRGEPCIFSAISWLQDNAASYIEAKAEIIVQKKETRDSSLVRYWIYSHHIYSKTKRREVLDLTNICSLTGFCMPGRPGIICIEGTTTDCNECWQAIKSMNWKKIFCKATEENKEEKDRKDFLMFSDFQEVVFQNSSVKCNHMDMGELYKYLEEHKLGYIFKELFGVEAKSN